MFLENPQDEISTRLAAAAQIRIAVAYWGQGAIERLGLQKAKGRDIKIVCDLLSGACNPAESKKLRTIFGTDRVRKLSRLHAKVWIIDDCVILGSSNASANGLGQQGREASDLIEANVLIRDQTSVAQISQWYETKVWKTATEITDTDIKIARERCKVQYRTRPVPPGTTVLEALQGDLHAMDGRDIVVYAWHFEDLDKVGKAALREEQNLRGNDDIICWDVTGSKKNELPPAGTHVIEFDLPNEKPRFDGIYRILLEDHISTRKGRDLLFRKKVARIEGLRVGDTKVWAEAIGRAIKARQGDGRILAMEVGEFARKYLKR
jgi:hypothetical protein